MLQRVLIFVLFFLGIEYLLRQLTELPNSLSWESFYIALVVSLLLNYATKVGKMILLSYLFLTMTVQVSNAFFYGSWIDPMNVYLLFSNIEEVLQIIPNLRIDVILKSTIIIIAFITLVYFYLKTKSPGRTYKSINILIIILLIFQPIRDGLISPEKMEKRFTKDNNGIIRASYNTFSIVLAMKLNDFFGSQVYPDYRHAEHIPNKKIGTKNINMVIYFGESLSSKYMSFYGYHKNTTPFINTLPQKYPYFLSKEAIAGSTATAVSTEHFFNLIPHPDGRKQIESAKTSLFRYAKKASFNTAYITTQALNYINHIEKKIGKKYMDKSLNPTTFTDTSYSYQKYANDNKLLNMYNSLNLKPPYFLVVQPFGSHAPFNQRTTLSDKFFGVGGNIIEYENSILHSDKIIRKLLNKLKNDSAGDPWVFIMTSDHGTYTNDNIVTRSLKYPESYTVPFFIITNNKNIYDDHIAPLKKCSMLFHQQIAEISAQILGYDVPLSPCHKGIITSGLLNGTGGTKKVKIIKNKVILTPY